MLSRSGARVLQLQDGLIAWAFGAQHGVSFAGFVLPVKSTRDARASLALPWPSPSQSRAPCPATGSVAGANGANSERKTRNGETK